MNDFFKKNGSWLYSNLVTQSEERGLFLLTKLEDFVFALPAECKKRSPLGVV
jgi:hypothetical protein